MVAVRHALSEIRANFADLGWWRDRVFVPFVVGPLTQLHPRWPGYDEAVRVMEADWDTLVVLDACRADVFEAVADLDRFDRYSRAVSLGSHSSEWTRRNFGGGSFGDTVYVSANPHTTLLAGDTFFELVEVWKEHDAVPNQIDPHHVVDAALDAHDRHPDKRLIVHFMQPHGTGGLVDASPSAEVTFRATTEAVLPVVDELLEGLDGKTVITADHGELFYGGVRATMGVTQHKARLRLPGLVYVPWAEVDGERRRVSEDATTGSTTDRESVEERLRDLGYRT